MLYRRITPEAYLEPSRTSTMERQQFFYKRFIPDVRLGCEYMANSFNVNITIVYT